MEEFRGEILSVDKAVYTRT